jgi:MFS family permease
MRTQATRETPVDYPPPSIAWYSVGVLMIAYTLSFADRYIIALLIEPIKSDLDLSDSQIGLLSGVAFAIFYTTLGVPIGRLADQYHRGRIISLGVFLWSLMTAACGLTKGFWQLFAARVGVGVGEAALSPAAFSIIADSFPPDRLSRALSVYSVGVYLGAGLAFIIGGAVIQLVATAPDVTLPLIGAIRPWQLTFIYVGLPGLIVALWVLTLREPDRRFTGNSSTLQAAPFREVMRFLRAGWRAYGSHFLGFSLLALIFNAIVIWSPAFFARQYGLSASDTGYALGLILVVFGGGGIVSGGWLADYLAKRGFKDATLRVGIIAAVGLMPFAILIPVMPDAAGALIVYCPLLFFSSFRILVRYYILA